MTKDTSGPWYEYSGGAFSGYDRVRQPNVSKELLQILSQSDTPLGQQRVLDGGFGTGAYIAHLRRHVLAIWGVEISEEGYQQALDRVAGATNVHLQRGSILELPFSAEYFHAYVVNQVLHHLDQDSAFPNLNLFIEESHRVLAPGGVLALNTCTQEQLEPGSGVYWHYRYLQERAVRTLQARYAPTGELVSRLALYDYRDIGQTMASGRIYTRRYYEDPTVALEAEFRNGDSVYSLLSESEVESANDHIRKAITDGSVHEEMRRAAERRAEIGEAVIVSARKSPDPTSRNRVGSVPGRREDRH